MKPESKKIEIADHKSSENVYLHKDFHRIMHYLIEYIDKNYGLDATEEFLDIVGHRVFSPLVKKLREQGLPALEEHWREIFTKESGDFTLKYEGPYLTLKVNKCPAIKFLCQRGLKVSDRFCLSTAIVIRAICRDAGYRCSCEYEPGQGKCVQKFWKSGGVPA